MSKPLQAYLSAIAQITQQGDAREESYYPALKALLEDLAKAEKKAIQVTVLPKPTEAGNPDFRVWDGAYQVIGYIEAKAPGTNLDRIQESDQLRRYRQTFPNLILTDFYEFRLYRKGEPLTQALLARPLIAQTLKLTPPTEQVETLLHLFQSFFAFALPPLLTPETLSVELARRTRFLREEVLLPELGEQIRQAKGPLYGFYTAFQKYLVAGLKPAEFADLYAQTLTYGLFAARTRAQNGFHRRLAHDLIPPTIGILRDVFHFISLGKLSPQMEATLDEMAAVLHATEVQAILKAYDAQGKGEDPILHFYETFLAEYDPATRERRGVYYTPQPVVRYIVRAVHETLKAHFGLRDGLADTEVTLLDPAAGTFTFLAEAIQVAFAESTLKYGQGAKRRLLENHLLPHFYAFELLMAPYAIGHIKISFLLEALEVPLRENQRFQAYLTNALEIEDLEQIPIPGLASLSEESHHAARIKKEEPILVILGNPPYSGLSANQNPWTEKLLKTDLDGTQSYYTVDDQPLREKNPKWLQDDYVKFLRFAQWKIHKAGRGIVAMITNHSYLDNPTFRGMRQSLMKTFDEIYILDLHGNSLKREKTPEGRPDENVFDIRQGVAISLFIKHRPAPPEREAEGKGRWQVEPALWHRLKPEAREMRKKPTQAEKLLWQYLRRKELGIKFRRQHGIDQFIVDFYARKARLIIEVDGAIHQQQKAYDIWRQSRLEDLGYQVLRFTNEQVLHDIQSVLAAIRRAVEPPPPAPPPKSGEGLGVGVEPDEAQKTAPKPEKKLGAKIFHAHLYGTRQEKYEWLGKHTFATTPYQPIHPAAPFYFFIPHQTENLASYYTWPAVNDLFPVHSVGIVTARDKLLIQWTPEEMWNTVFRFSQMNEELAREAFQLGKDARDWKVSLAQQDVKRDDGPHRKYIVPILYRPFDVRYTYYTGRSRGFHCRPRPEVMHHMLAGDNLALIVTRQVKASQTWQHCFISNRILESCIVSNQTSEIGYGMPLYLYPSADAQIMLEEERKPNLTSGILEKLTRAYHFTPLPEEILAYMYAVLYSPTYRQKESAN
jgi:very-short-patch-repair endonuclease